MKLVGVMKSVVGALFGAVLFGLVVGVGALLLEWVGFGDGLLVATGVGAICGAILGWLRPRLVLLPLEIFLDGGLVD